MAAHDRVPSSDDLAKALALEVLDNKGQPHTVESLLDAAPRVVVVFVRHFYCGGCQDYASLVSRVLSPGKLSPATSVVFIGCGGHVLIDDYAEITQCAWPIYSDSAGKVFDALGMIKTWADGPPSQYSPQSQFQLFIRAMRDIIPGFLSGKPLHAGNPQQVGGEFVVETRNGEKAVTWCHRMQNHRDHTEVPDLCKVLGVPEPEPVNNETH